MRQSRAYIFSLIGHALIAALILTIRPDARPVEVAWRAAPVRLIAPSPLQHQYRLKPVPRRDFHLPPHAALSRPRSPELPRLDAPPLVAAEAPHTNPAVTLPSIPPPRIQTGGFGDTELIPAERAPVARSSGPGFGAAAVVLAEQRKTAVRPGGFGDARVTPAASPPIPAGVARASPVEILFKPKPVYTAEARKLRLQGEVVLKVLFAASGELQVLNVVQPLGHGLDEAAQSAASRIQFKPAHENGKAVDTTALVRIVFELVE